MLPLLLPMTQLTKVISVITDALVTTPHYALLMQLMQAGVLLLCSFWHAQPVACVCFMLLIPFVVAKEVQYTCQKALHA